VLYQGGNSSKMESLKDMGSIPYFCNLFTGESPR
jgi:hypothetical protein